jgi:microcystin-dependent protein
LSSGQGVALTNRGVGSTGGVETVTLTVDQMPSHNHSGATTSDNSTNNGSHTHTSATAAIGNYGSRMLVYNQEAINIYSDSRTGSTLPVTVPSESSSHNHKISSQGGDKSHENMPPFYVLAFIMRIS